MTPEECLVIYGEAWFERDPARRLEVLRRCCTEDIVFVDQSGRLDGLEAVSDMIGRAIGCMSAGAPAKTKLWAMIESPYAILHAEEIAAASERLAVLVLGTGAWFLSRRRSADERE